MILGQFGGIGVLELIIVGAIALLMFGLFPYCCWKIVKKTGFPAWWSLAVLLPGVNVALLIMLAFSDWPALRDQQTDEMFS